jgi:hypothetical protein
MAMTGARAAAVARPDAAASPATSRAGWMDNLRVAVIAGVIILHAATAYILDVDWYYQERTTSTLTPLLLAFPALLGGLFGSLPSIGGRQRFSVGESEKVNGPARCACPTDRACLGHESSLRDQRPPRGFAGRPGLRAGALSG